jgi:hypothetical protein
MEDMYKVILRSIENMFSAINTNLKDGKFTGTENSIDMVKSLVDDIKSKSPTDRKAQINSVVRDSIQLIKSQNDFIPDYIINKLNQF